MKNYYKAVDFIQWVWKKSFNLGKSKSQIRRDLEQGAIKLNDQKIKIDDVFVFDNDDLDKK